MRKNLILSSLAALIVSGLVPFAPAPEAAAASAVVGSVAAHSTDEWTTTLPAGLLSRIRVIGDGDTDLDLYVYDENGNLVGSDTGPTDRGLVLVRPLWTGPFKIHVVNRGPVFNRYVLRVE